MFFGGYGLYLLISLPALLLGLWAQAKIRGAYNQYSRIRTSSGITGGDVARRLLDAHGLGNVKIEQSRGTLSDHYDPRSRTLRLSQPVFQGNSLASAGIAAHEVGHAIQHKDSYGPLRLRSMLIPTVRIGSWLGPILFFIGFYMASETLAIWGVGLFAAVAVFSLITIPVETNASKRAKQILASEGILYQQEVQAVDKVLDAAALTYVAGAAQSISTLLYYILLLGGRSSRRRS